MPAPCQLKLKLEIWQPATMISVVVYVISFWQECRHRKPRWTGVTHQSHGCPLSSIRWAPRFNMRLLASSMLKLTGIAVPLFGQAIWKLVISLTMMKNENWKRISRAGHVQHWFRWRYVWPFVFKAITFSVNIYIQLGLLVSYSKMKAQ